MKLADYLASNEITRPQFAELIGTSTEAVRRYCEETRIPERDIMLRIVEQTGGEVTANDFFGIAA